jgi:hypothetical protein
MAMDVNVQNSILSLSYFAQTIQKRFPTVDKHSRNKEAVSKHSDAVRAAKMLNALATLLSRGTKAGFNRVVSVLASPDVQSSIEVVIAK